ncbi:hypothetical protein [Filimonas effusa]|uniref:Uncharacterized protein n=1 Tax=Filimonas effusa TaxID=2508721 RepID=A0A4V1MAT5_9BACT|nr:hypothetical protein [Filimonas effusa]RXK86996.1 hypothetical protein ESB13_09500 [Filimonas effusa]
MNDEYYLGHSDGYNAGKRQAASDKQHAELFKKAILAFFKVLYILLIYSSAIITSYLILRRFSFYQSLGKLESICLVILGAYFLTCLIFFLKGIMIALRQKRHWGWFIIFGFIFLYLVGIPAYLSHLLFDMWLKPPVQEAGEIGRYNILSWFGGLLVGGIIYAKYRLLENSSFAITKWAYISGYTWVLSK